MSSEIELEIGAGTGGYVVRVVRAVAGGEPEGVLRLDVDEVLGRLELIEAKVLASAVAGRFVSDDERPVREIGERLFGALFSGSVYGMYRASVGMVQQRGTWLRVVLRLTDPRLAALPWEAMFDPETGGYLCRQEPLVRHVPAPYTPEPLRVSPPLRILGLIASPRGLAQLDVEAERDRLAGALAGPAAEGLVEVEWVPEATWARVHARLLRGEWHVVHFIGHGDYDTETGEGFLALVGDGGRADRVEAGRIVDLLSEARPVPRLVVLNSCSSGRAGSQDLFSGTAAALARSGVSAVVAMQFAISDSAAIAFARGFYTALAGGRTVDAAVRSGRISILGAPRSLEWVTPVLYLRGDVSHLFDLTAVAAPRHQRAAELVQAGDVVIETPEVAGGPPTELADLAADTGWTAALEAFHAGRWDEAAGLLEALVARYPGDVRVTDRLESARRRRDLAEWSAEADTAASRADWARAIELLDRLTAADSNYENAARRLEQARSGQRCQMLAEQIAQMSQAGQWSEVVTAAEQLSTLDPAWPDPGGIIARARRELAEEDLASRYGRAVQLLDAGQREPAATLFAAIEQERPGYRDATMLLATASGEPPTWFVSKTAGHHATIAAAITACAPGDRILIRPGEYDESLIISKDIQIGGVGPSGDTIIRTSDTAAFRLEAARPQISNLTIRQVAAPTSDPGEEQVMAALLITGGQPIVRECDISSQAGPGILVSGTADPLICSNRIHDGENVGVLVCEQGRGTFEDNDITANALSGIEIRSGADPVFRSNRIHDGKDRGVTVSDNGRGTFEDNDITANAKSGVGVGSGGDPVFRSNRLHDGNNAGVLVETQGRGTFEDNDITGNALAGITVRSGGDPVFRSNRIYDGKSFGIIVHANGRGTFENNDITANADPGVAIVSGGDPVFRSNRIHDGKDRGVSVSDNGRGTFEDNDIAANIKAGVAVESAGDPVFRSNRIHDGKSSGIYVRDKGRGRFEDNDITANLRAGVRIESSGAPVICGNRINKNRDRGIIVTWNGSGTIIGNVITSNTPGDLKIGITAGTVKTEENRTSA